MRNLFMLALSLAGCASPLALDERANGQTAEVEQGRPFTVSLPGSSWKLTPPGGVVASTSRDHDDSANRDVFHLKAEAAGEVELRFSKEAPGEPKKECVIRLRVTPPSEYHMKPHTG